MTDDSTRSSLKSVKFLLAFGIFIVIYTIYSQYDPYAKNEGQKHNKNVEDLLFRLDSRIRQIYENVEHRIDYCTHKYDFMIRSANNYNDFILDTLRSMIPDMRKRNR